VATLPQLPAKRATDGAAPGPATDTALLRLSDAEREAAVAVFNEAVADGRLSWQEHAERVELAWGCRTHAELAPYLTDLGRPAVATAVPQRVVAVGSKIVRSPEPGRRVEARALFGAVFLKLTDAAPGEELLVDASSFCGKVVLIVGADATVIDEGNAVLGKRKILASAPAGDGPLIRITGRSTLGHLKVLQEAGYWD
jgi:hypothetical protein